jgi:hypothetical protein
VIFSSSDIDRAQSSIEPITHGTGEPRIQRQIPAIWATICSNLQRCFHLEVAPHTLDWLAVNPLSHQVPAAERADKAGRHKAQFHLDVARRAAWNALRHWTTPISEVLGTKTAQRIGNHRRELFAKALQVRAAST